MINVRILLLVIIVILNMRSYALYRDDKGYALLKRERIPEKALLKASVTGGIGAITAIQICRHKTQNLPLVLSAIASAVVQAVILVLI